MDHSHVPVLEALSRYRECGEMSFTPPSHKQGRGIDPRVRAVLGNELFASDVLVLNGLDDRRMSRGILAEAQRLMADAVGAEHAFFSTSGSSLSVKSAMVAVAGPHEKLLVSRNAHKSVVASLIISGVQPVWVRPRWDGQRHLSHPPGADAVRAGLEATPEAKGMLLITPTDYGTCGDIRATAQMCHQYDCPLIVDEAWGAHFPFHQDLPTWAMDSEADLCVTSVHKMGGGGIEQSSVFHLQGDRVDPTVLKAREDLLGTTSPSTLIYASLDGWRRQMVEHGQALLGAALVLARSVRTCVAALPGLQPMGASELLGPRLGFEFDPLKIVIDVHELGISGYQAADWLAEHRRVHVGLSDHRRITVQLTYADNEETAAVLLGALRDLVEKHESIPPPHPVDLPDPRELELETAMLPRDAFFGPASQVPAKAAIGHIAAEMISPYPPGVPVVAPGELVTEPVVDYLRSGVAAGMHIPDAADPSLDTFRVVSSPVN